VRDLQGVELNTGDQVLFPLTTGQLVLGQVIQINSGLATPANPQAIPSIVIRLDLALPGLPNGIVMGLTKINPPPPVVGEPS
jgi:hypothetical protein